MTAGPGTLADTLATGDLSDKEAMRRHLSSGRASLGEMFGGHLERSSHGAWLTTSDGQRFLNCAGYGTLLLGATHPRVVEAVVDQVRRHPISSRILAEPVAARAARALARVTPRGLDKVHFVGSGAEAVEAAIKLARAHGHTRLVTTQDGYHGKTMGALSLTAREMYQAPFRPLLPDVVQVPYGDVAALEAALEGQPPSLFVVEPVQGEAGVVIPPDGYLRAVADACRRHGCLLAVDEVLTGLGRTGSWFAVDRDGVVPDMLLVGKALSGGVVPVSALVATELVYGPFDKDPFIHTSTFAGAPVAMAAAEAAVHALEEIGAPARAGVLGRRIREGLQASLGRHVAHLVRDLRGSGLLIGVEFVDPGYAGEAMLELVAHRLLVNHSLNNGAVLRLTPPVTLTDQECALLLDVWDAAMAALASTFPPPPGRS